LRKHIHVRLSFGQAAAKKKKAAAAVKEEADEPNLPQEVQDVFENANNADAVRTKAVESVMWHAQLSLSAV
jgi:hypothetical protein